MFVAHGPRDERFRSVARRRRARVGRPVTPRPERRVAGNRRRPLALRDRGRCKGPTCVELGSVGARDKDRSHPYRGMHRRDPRGDASIGRLDPSGSARDR
jgi:hypothetical protein